MNKQEEKNITHLIDTLVEFKRLTEKYDNLTRELLETNMKLSALRWKIVSDLRIKQ